jgi:flagellar protein FlgJ
MIRIGAAPGTPAAGGGDAERLRAASRQMEGVFVQQMFKAMRETVPGGGIVDGGAGEEVFTGLMDEHLASQAAQGNGRGPGEALFLQLRAAWLAGQPDPAAAAESMGSNGSLGSTGTADAAGAGGTEVVR